MNSVREPGPNGNSKTSPSRKPVRKTKPGARAPNWPSRHAQVRTGAPRRTHGLLIVARSRPCSGKGPAVSQAPVAVSQRPCRTPRALPPAPQRPTPQRQRLLAQRACFAPNVVSWAQFRMRQCRVVAVCARRHGRIVACLATQCPAA